MNFRVLHFVALLLIASQVSRCQSEDLDSEENEDFVMSTSVLFSNLRRYRVWNEYVDTNRTTEHFDFGRKLLGVSTNEPSTVDISYNFLNNTGGPLAFVAGKEYMLLLDVKNNGNSDLLMIATLGTIYPPNNHDHVIQRLIVKVYIMHFVRASSTRTFPCRFVVSEDLKVGKYDLVGTVLYDMDDTPGNKTFFNGTIEIVEDRVTKLVRTTVYITLGFLYLYFLWWGCKKLYQKREDNKRAQKEREEAEIQWLLEETAAVARSSSKKKTKSKKN